MALIYNPNKRIFTLHTKHSTYQMQVDSLGYLLHLYYGAKNNGSMEYVLTYADRGFSGNPYAAGADRTYSLDALPQEFPTLGTGDYRNIALDIKGDNGVEGVNLLYKRHEIRKGKYVLNGLPAVWAKEEEAQTLEIVLADEAAQVEVHLLYGVLEDVDVITRSVVIKNIGTGSVTIEKASAACLDFVSGDYDVFRFYGRHAMERNLERTPLGHGTICFGSRRGTSSHQYNPAVILAEHGATEDSGACYGMLMVYSGNFLCEAEKDQFEQTRLLMGLNDELFSYLLAAGETFTVPEVILSYSANGLSELSQQYHKCIRDHVCRSKYVHESRPVLINSWEAAYFDFTGDTIVDLAKEAASLGIDMVVMDDGWFGHRNDDSTSLGDWFVNEEKITGGLKYLVDEVNKLGLKFGIWMEPEMISPDSKLYKEHPDWAIAVKDRVGTLSRNQYVLDLSRKEVRDCIYDKIHAILSSANIAYVKWDMNRQLTDMGSLMLPADRQGELAHRYVLGVYEMQERLIHDFPDLLLENCSGGGARFDPGMLYYSPQIWCSDDTDAIERLGIQEGTSLIYPLSTMGAHVSDCPNHTVGRVTPFKTRGDVALAGTFGYELDITKIAPEEQEAISGQVALYHKYNDLVREGDYYRIASLRENHYYDCYMVVAKDQSEALVTFVNVHARPNYHSKRICLQGLDPKREYRLEETGTLYGGDLLMNAGFLVPSEQGDYRSYLYHFVDD